MLLRLAPRRRPRERAEGAPAGGTTLGVGVSWPPRLWPMVTMAVAMIARTTARPMLLTDSAAPTAARTVGAHRGELAEIAVAAQG